MRVADRPAVLWRLIKHGPRNSFRPGTSEESAEPTSENSAHVECVLRGCKIRTRSRPSSSVQQTLQLRASPQRVQRPQSYSKERILCVLGVLCGESLWKSNDCGQQILHARNDACAAAMQASEQQRSDFHSASVQGTACGTRSGPERVKNLPSLRVKILRTWNASCAAARFELGPNRVPAFSAPRDV